MRVGRLAALLLAAALSVAGSAGLAGCAADQHPAPELVVGSGSDPESTLLAGIYVAALRSYGFAARAESATDPMAKLDSGAFTVLPAFTGRMLQTLQPGASVLSDSQVYRVMISALPEGIAAGDYTTAAEDKPALVVTQATAAAWGGSDLSADLSALPAHCAGLVVGRGRRSPDAVGGGLVPVARAA